MCTYSLKIGILRQKIHMIYLPVLRLCACQNSVHHIVRIVTMLQVVLHEFSSREALQSFLGFYGV